MRRLMLVIVFLAILVGSGVLANGFAQSSAASVPGVRIQTSNPEASTAIVTSAKGQSFMIWATVLIIGPLVTFSVILPFLFFFASRWIKAAKDAPNQGFSFSLNPGVPNSLGAALLRRPLLTGVITLLIIALLAVGAAITFNIFNAR